MKRVCDKIMKLYGAAFAWVFFLAMTTNGATSNWFSNPINAVLSIATMLAFAASFTSMLISVVRFIRRRPLKRLRNIAADIIGTYHAVKDRRKEMEAC